jgi:hypothetical protein
LSLSNVRFEREAFATRLSCHCRTKYRRFATAAEALRYAVEDLRTPKVFGASLEVGDDRLISPRCVSA